MLITKDTPKLAKKNKVPGFKWQKGDYANIQEFRFHLPYSFLLLCKLWGVTPNDVLDDFMDNLSCGSWKRQGRDKAKEHLKNYALEMGYGHQHYTREDIQQMFLELDSIGLLWPEHAKMKVIEMHTKWRNKYYNWWFKKWFKKYQRKPSLENHKI